MPFKLTGPGMVQVGRMLTKDISTSAGLNPCKIYRMRYERVAFSI